MTATQHAESSQNRLRTLSSGAARFELRAILGLFALMVGAVPFLALLLLLQKRSAALQRLDDDVAKTLNEVVSRSPDLVHALRGVTDLGGNGAAVYAFTLAVIALAIRSQHRLAAYVLTTGLGLAILVPLTKALVARPRPQLPVQIVEVPTNASFPSGHAMVSLVTWSIVAVVLMPAVRPRLRPWLLAAALLVAAAVGFTRLALGVHYVSDVVAGWALGAGWLAVTTAAFRGWQRDQGLPALPLTQGLDRDAAAPSAPAPPERILPRGRATVGALAASAAAVVLVLSTIGLIVTGPLVDSALGRLDRSVVLALLEMRTEWRTDVARLVAALSGTRMVVAVTLALMVLSRAVTRSWRPVVFVVVTVLGEVLLYFVTAQVVGRGRPDVPDLTSGLPVGASWPSGHAAAAVAVYGALAALVLVRSRSRWRWSVLVLPVVLPPVIALTRVYVAAHHPTDVVAGLTLGAAWVFACTRLLLLDAPPAARASADDSRAFVLACPSRDAPGAEQARR